MKALVVYGTRYGTAFEIAVEISKVLKKGNFEVELVNAKGNEEYDISPYNLVVVGSGIKMGKWTKESQKFLKNNEDMLSTRKVALFVSCGAANDKKTIAEGQEKYLDMFAKKNLKNKPIATGLFGSIYDPNANHGLLYKMVNISIKKEVKKQGKNPNKRYDYRNWEEIRLWTEKIIFKYYSE